jgi:hypothetical protein
VKDGIAASDCFFEGSRVAQIAGRRFGVKPLKIFKIAGRTDEQAQLRALLGENAGDVGAKESGSASNESFQNEFSILSLKQGLADQRTNDLQ